MRSTLVKANTKGKSPTQLIKDLKAINKYMEEPRTDLELAQKAKQLDLIDGLPFTYVLWTDRFDYEAVITIDLDLLQSAYAEIHLVCEALAPYSPTIGTPQYQPHSYLVSRKSGLTPLNRLLRNQIRFIYDAVASIKHSLTHDNNAVLGELLNLSNSQQKIQAIDHLSTLTYNFCRDYFAEIPLLLAAIDAEPSADYYLFNYRGSFDIIDITEDENLPLLAIARPDIAENIQQLVADRKVAEDLLGRAECLFEEAESFLETATEPKDFYPLGRPFKLNARS